MSDADDRLEELNGALEAQLSQTELILANSAVEEAVTLVDVGLVYPTPDWSERAHFEEAYVEGDYDPVYNDEDY